MMYGLTESEFKFLSDTVINPLKSLGARVYLFGSRASGNFKKFSDIDLLYVTSPDRAILPHEIYEIVSTVEDSNFAYKIDLVAANELAESYRTNIAKEKILL